MTDQGNFIMTTSIIRCVTEAPFLCICPSVCHVEMYWEFLSIRWCWLGVSYVSVRHQLVSCQQCGKICHSHHQIQCAVFLMRADARASKSCNYHICDLCRGSMDRLEVGWICPDLGCISTKFRQPLKGWFSPSIGEDQPLHETFSHCTRLICWLNFNLSHPHRGSREDVGKVLRSLATNEDISGYYQKRQRHHFRVVMLWSVRFWRMVRYDWKQTE